MAGLQMPKRGDGAAMLRELRDEERPALAVEQAPPVVEQTAPAAEQPTNGHTPVLTEIRAYGSADAREEARTGASTEVSAAGSRDALTDAGTEGRRPARKSARAAVSKEARPQVRKEERAHADKNEDENGPADVMEAVEVALASREPLIGGVKATVDMSPELSTRSKRYLADHRGQNTRQVLIALFDAYLSAKGY